MFIGGYILKELTLNYIQIADVAEDKITCKLFFKELSEPCTTQVINTKDANEYCKAFFNAIHSNNLATVGTKFKVLSPIITTEYKLERR